MDEVVTETARLFLDMAERIGRMAEGDFAGAILVVPPDGEPVEMLVVDPKRNAGHFWMAAKSRVDAAFAEFTAKSREQQMGVYGRR